MRVHIILLITGFITLLLQSISFALDTQLHNRWMIRRDLPEVGAIARASKQSLAEEDFADLLKDRDVIGMVVEDTSGRIVGYSVYRLLPSSLEVLTWGVSPEEPEPNQIRINMIQYLKNKLNKSRNRDKVDIRVLEPNLEEQHFLKSLNFRGSVPKDETPHSAEAYYRFTFRNRHHGAVLGEIPHLLKSEALDELMNQLTQSREMDSPWQRTGTLSPEKSGPKLSSLQRQFDRTFFRNKNMALLFSVGLSQAAVAFSTGSDFFAPTSMVSLAVAGWAAHKLTAGWKREAEKSLNDRSPNEPKDILSEAKRAGIRTGLVQGVCFEVLNRLTQSLFNTF